MSKPCLEWYVYNGERAIMWSYTNATQIMVTIKSLKLMYIIYTMTLYNDFIQWLYTMTLYNDFIQWLYTHARQRNMDILHWKMITLRFSFIVLAGELCSHTLYCSKATGYAIIHHSQIVLYLERIYKLLWGWYLVNRIKPHFY